ncbi:hypothetical protein JQS43_12510 [Natronosporangium hydrolyticum]|uniref:Uncharacterized protein n=1 Tax=Natronosporangium hydrolyticum TaxID=2811111 RepID=A0A895YHJ1_9ACTN|nr:DUF6445 family protein [Natronosporangium hydrolyticum]QSB17011.1 hypothetical protein JQS43_12510 [Natronosporangium hydrolyticum]
MRKRLVVVDGFYADPDAVRQLALNSAFNSADRYNYPGWQSNKALRTDALQARIEGILGRGIDVDPDRLTWGGFRLITDETGERTKVHADSAVDWAGMVYLTPDAPSSAGTGFFRHRETGRERPPTDREARRLGFADADEFEERVVRRDMADLSKWEIVSWVGPTYNRLVLFRGCEFYHAPLGGLGDRPANARLTHNFFFNERIEVGTVGRVLGKEVVSGGVR